MKKINKEHKEKLKKAGLFIAFIIVSFSIFTTVKLMYHLYGQRFEFPEENITYFEKDLNQLKDNVEEIRKKYKTDYFVTKINDLCNSGEIFLNFMKNNPKTSYIKLNKNLILLGDSLDSRSTDLIISEYMRLMSANNNLNDQVLRNYIDKITYKYKNLLNLYMNDTFNYENKKTIIYLQDYFEAHLELTEMLLKG